MKASEKRDVINRLIKATGSDLPEVTTADQIFWERNKRLKAATDAITDLQIGEKPERETALADIPTTDKHTVSDLPETVANALRQPYGSLGLDDSPTWGPTSSPWFIFQHAAEDFMRGKLSRSKLRKMPQTAERLELAIGCLQWARTCAASLDADPRGASAQFEAAFTSSLILDRDATAELNGETIDIPPSDTECPTDKAVLMQILGLVKELQTGQADIKTGQEEIMRGIKADNKGTVTTPKRLTEEQVDKAISDIDGSGLWDIRKSRTTKARTLRRWINGKGSPDGFVHPLSTQWELFITTAKSAGDMKIKMRNHLGLANNITEASNLRTQGGVSRDRQPKGVFG